MAFRYDTYCGLYCGACPVLVANETGQLAETARKWDMKPEELVCGGCKSGVECVYCRSCRLKACAQDKQIESCVECAEYPCLQLIDFRNDSHPHHSAVLGNLSRIRKIGVRNWLTEQKTRWSCSMCGTRFTWYDETCAQCGSRLYNCRSEDDELSREDGKD
jgi:hypothetical protein